MIVFLQSRQVSFEWLVVSVVLCERKVASSVRITWNDGLVL